MTVTDWFHFGRTALQSQEKRSLPAPLIIPTRVPYIIPPKGIDMSGIKSAYELAMERAGGKTSQLTDEQKTALAEIDSKTKAKVAETEIMFEQQITAETDPAKTALIKQTRQEQIARIKSDAEAEKEAVRRDA
jgi:hypothetical protein